MRDRSLRPYVPQKQALGLQKHCDGNNPMSSLHLEDGEISRYSQPTATCSVVRRDKALTQTRVNFNMTFWKRQRYRNKKSSGISGAGEGLTAQRHGGDRTVPNLDCGHRSRLSVLVQIHRSAHVRRVHFTRRKSHLVLRTTRIKVFSPLNHHIKVCYSRSEFAWSKTVKKTKEHWQI